MREEWCYIFSKKNHSSLVGSLENSVLECHVFALPIYQHFDVKGGELLDVFLVIMCVSSGNMSFYFSLNALFSELF